MANGRGLFKAAAHVQRGNTEPMLASFLLIISHAWAPVYAKIRNSNKKSSQLPTSLLDGVAGLRVWHILTKMSGMKLLLNWSRFGQASQKDFLHFKFVLLSYVSI